jgi:hypothetical protein
MSLQFEGLSIQEKISLSLEQNSREIGLLLVIKKHFEVKRDIAKQSMMCS